MNKFLIAFLAVILALSLCGCHTGRSSLSHQKAPGSPQSALPNATLEAELQKLITAGEAANAQADPLSEANSTNSSLSPEDLQKLQGEVRAKQDTARQGYLEFIKRHPAYGHGYAAYGDFLLGHYDELGARQQLEKALELNAKTPTVYNDLANIYGHRGNVKEAFNYYGKAVELDPSETIYFQNFATTVFLFRPDAREYYNINEQQVFDKAMLLYSNAMRLDSTNFALAEDVAKSYYGIKPWRFDAAMHAWTNALNLAQTDKQRQDIYTHCARIQIQAGNYTRAREFLDAVTDPEFSTLKRRMLKTIDERQRTTAEAIKQ